jgi:hypothetical protein
METLQAIMSFCARSHSTSPSSAIISGNNCLCNAIP